MSVVSDSNNAYTPESPHTNGTTVGFENTDIEGMAHTGGMKSMDIDKIKLEDAAVLKETGELENDRLRDDNKHRNSLVFWMKCVVAIWMGLVITLIFLSGFRISFHISDAVFVALLSTTTVNVLGLAYIILKGLFK